MTNLIGQSLGRYHILEQLGEGGMATIFKAFDTRLEATVAIKVIRTENLPQSGVERARKRFEREAKALAQLNHPNIVKVTDYGEYGGRPYLVMPYLEGGTLKRLIQDRGALPWQEAVHLLLPISKALAYAHQHGMVHRDVKPSNVLITDSGEPMLSDFGVTKIIEDETTIDLTGTSAAVGTPEYMAPEQATSKSIDHRVDIYSLGIVFYEMVTGRKPYVADTPLAVLIKHARDPLPRPSQFLPGLPVKVERVLLKALSKVPEDRYQTMGEFTVALEQCLAEVKVDQRKLKSALVSTKPARNGIVPPQIKKTMEHKEILLVTARRPTISTSLKPSRLNSEPGARGKSGRRLDLISGVVVLAALLCLGAVLLLVFAARNKNILEVFASPTVTFTSSPTRTLTPTVGLTNTPLATATEAPTTTPTSTALTESVSTTTTMPKPKSTATNKPNPIPTDTNVPQPVPTATSVPPTLTSTPVTPAPTATPVPPVPTETPVPPAPTAT